MFSVKPINSVNKTSVRAVSVELCNKQCDENFIYEKIKMQFMSEMYNINSHFEIRTSPILHLFKL